MSCIAVSTALPHPASSCPIPITLSILRPLDSIPSYLRYEAGDLLKDAIAECQAAAGSGDAAAAAALPRLQLRRGLILLETDLLAEGETCTLAGVEALERSALLNALLLQVGLAARSDGRYTARQTSCVARLPVNVGAIDAAYTLHP